MSINWHKVKYVKGALPYLHRATVPIIFALDYFRLRLKIRQIKRENPDRKVVIINLLEHFGDIVACEPVARYVRRIQPNAFIFWSVRKPYRELLTHNSSIDEVLTVHCLSEWMLLSKSGLFDELIDLQLQDKECPVCQRPFHKGVGNGEITIENYYNYGNLLAAFCQSAGIPIIEDQPKLSIPDEVRNRIDALDLPGKYIVVHCASNEKSRDWLKEKWVQLTQKIIRELELTVVEIGLQPTLECESGYHVNLCGQLSLLETAEVLRRAALFIGIDSGPSHLANAVGTYGVILLGEYRIFKRYMPYSGGYKTGENATCIYADGPAANIYVDEVYKAVSYAIVGKLT